MDYWDLKVKSGGTDPLNPPLLKDIFKASKTDGKEGGFDPSGKGFDYLLRRIFGKDGLTDPATPQPVKDQISRTVFDPRNAGWLADLGRDYIDDQGINHPGKFAVWSNMGTPEVFKAIASSSDPRVKEMYKNYMERTFGFELFTPEIQNLNNLGSQPNIRMKWNNENHKFGFDVVDRTTGRVVAFDAHNEDKIYYTEPKPGALTIAGAPIVDPNALREMRRSVRSLNSALTPISRIAALEKTDVNTYLLNLLTNMRVDLTKVDNVPQKFKRAIIQSNEEIEQRKTPNP
jgi:hypothetical protein